MAKVVFILGAGASAHTNAPLMKNFFSDGMALFKNEIKNDNKDREHFEKIKGAYQSIEKIYANFILSPPLENIESLFSLIEIGRIINKFPNCNSKNSINKLLESIKKFIVRTLELKTKFEIDKKNGNIIHPDLYNIFCRDIISNLIKDSSRTSCSIISFNYDIALDFVLEKHFEQINYCLDNSFDDFQIKLLKLHGSINWGICKKCNKVASYPVYSNIFIARAAQSKPLEISASLQCKICKQFLKPLIVPPTWNKTENYHINSVWKAASKELSDSEYIFVIGYSLPPTDLFFQYLLALGMIDALPIKGFWVFDPETKTRERFEKLIGPRLKNNRKFHSENKYFRGAIYEIKNILKIKDSSEMII